MSEQQQNMENEANKTVTQPKTDNWDKEKQFRDEATAAQQRVEALKAENEALKVEKADLERKKNKLDPDKSTIEEVITRQNAITDELAQNNQELNEKLAKVEADRTAAQEAADQVINDQEGEKVISLMQDALEKEHGTVDRQAVYAAAAKDFVGSAFNQKSGKVFVHPPDVRIEYIRSRLEAHHIKLASATAIETVTGEIKAPNVASAAGGGSVEPATEFSKIKPGRVNQVAREMTRVRTHQQSQRP